MFYAFKGKLGCNQHCLAESDSPVHEPVCVPVGEGRIPWGDSMKTEEAATTLALGSLCCLTHMPGAMSDHTCVQWIRTPRGVRGACGASLSVPLLPPSGLSPHLPPNDFKMCLIAVICKTCFWLLYSAHLLLTAPDTVCHPLFTNL